VKLHLGAGGQILEGYINIDSRDLAGIDIVRDVLRGLPFSDETVDEIYSENFLEHLPPLEMYWFFNEMWRVLKPGGTARHLVPVAGSIAFYQDMTHQSFFVEETFTYFQVGHWRNAYYGGAIKPWVIDSITYTDPNHLLDVKMTKP
jgi:predicted SAM-dependent methyltransferase